MPQFIFTNNTYAGEALAGFMASTLLGADAVERGLLTVLTDVKARRILLDVDDDVILQDRSARFVDQATTGAQNESYLDPVVFEFMKEMDWSNLITTWESQAIKPGSMSDFDGIVELSDFMVARYGEKIKIANERLYYLGKAGSPFNTFTAAFPGLISQIGTNAATFKASLTAATSANTQMTATAIDATGVVTVADTSLLNDGDVVSIKVTAGAIKETTNVAGGIALLNTVFSYYIQILSSTTFKLVRNHNDINTRKNATFTGVATAATIAYINKSNVLSVLAKVYNQLDPADRIQADFKLQVPLHLSWAYAQAQADKATNVLNAFTDKKEMDYLGEKLTVMNHWNGNTIIGARTSNLFLGVDLLSDESELWTKNLKEVTGDGVVRMKASMKACTQVKFFNEVFYLGF